MKRIITFIGGTLTTILLAMLLGLISAFIPADKMILVGLFILMQLTCGFVFYYLVKTKAFRIGLGFGLLPVIFGLIIAMSDSGGHPDFNPTPVVDENFEKEEYAKPLFERLTRLNNGMLREDISAKVDTIKYDHQAFNNGLHSIFLELPDFETKSKSELILKNDSLFVLYSENDSICYHQSLFKKTNGDTIDYIGYLIKEELHCFYDNSSDMGPNYFCIDPVGCKKIDGLPVWSNNKGNYYGSVRFYQVVGDVILNVQIWERNNKGFESIVNIDLDTHDNEFESYQKLNFSIREVGWLVDSFVFTVDNKKLKESIRVEFRL